jgi:hypothetical protein
VALRAKRRSSCVSGNVRVAAHGPDARQVSRLVVLLGGRRVASSRAVVRGVRLPRGRQSLLRVRASTYDGRVVTLDRRLTACR